MSKKYPFYVILPEGEVEADSLEEARAVLRENKETLDMSVLVLEGAEPSGLSQTSRKKLQDLCYQIAKKLSPDDLGKTGKHELYGWIRSKKLGSDQFTDLPNDLLVELLMHMNQKLNEKTHWVEPR